ncbi:RTA1 like protein-domain-containing protein [Stachybotrys elegans]|uniref:RTA1 like protein-domain-containing protein n=1 Tax=Stachybotrys elegans TaxID=80388 RepID=A0A8K0T4V5_9HYPO|nr:RTA1 like protein-domain-containing protein [Stachybotrys elegans]
MATWNGYETFGSDANCTLSVCPVEASILGYRPSVPANAFFLAAFGVIGIVHIYFGWRWKSWGFMTGMLLGCASEMIGYGGRLMMYDNPFSFSGFMIQIVCLTIAPVFFTASIYVTLSKAIVYFDPELSRFKPQFFYWIFLPLDIICLVLQAAGGALSTTSDNNQLGVNISMAGLILQVVVLVLFTVAFSDYMIRYLKRHGASGLKWRARVFFTGLITATILILARCCYRVAELREGYSGELMRHEIPFIIMEGVVIVLASISLFFGHPGLVFKDKVASRSKLSGSDSVEAGFNMEQPK